MKYFLILLAGAILGTMLFAAGMYFNPFARQLAVSPFAVSDNEQINFAYSAVPTEAILYTDNGESVISTHPARVTELWEPTVADSSIAVILLENALGEVAALGIKFSSRSESTELLKSTALVNSAWHIYIPGRGTLLVDQVENYWSYLRDIVIPARWSSHDAGPRRIGHRTREWRQWRICGHGQRSRGIVARARLFSGVRSGFDGRQSDHYLASHRHRRRLGKMVESRSCDRCSIAFPIGPNLNATPPM